MNKERYCEIILRKYFFHQKRINDLLSLAKTKQEIIDNELTKANGINCDPKNNSSLSTSAPFEKPIIEQSTCEALAKCNERELKRLEVVEKVDSMFKLLNEKEIELISMKYRDELPDKEIMQKIKYRGSQQAFNFKIKAILRKIANETEQLW